MRIAPVGLVFAAHLRGAQGAVSHATLEPLRRCVEEALRFSHVHPLAVDGATAVAFVVATAAAASSDSGGLGLEPATLLRDLRDHVCASSELKERFGALHDRWEALDPVQRSGSASTLFACLRQRGGHASAHRAL